MKHAIPRAPRNAVAVVAALIVIDVSAAIGAAAAFAALQLQPPDAAVVTNVNVEPRASLDSARR